MTSPGPSRRAVLGALLLAAAPGLAACAGRRTSYGDVVLAGGEPDGTFVKVSRLIAGQLRQGTEFDSARVVLTNGSVENLDLLAAGRVQLAPALADAAVASGDPGVVAVARIYQHTMHCLVRADGPVRTLEDLAGRPISIGAEGSGTAATASRLLRVAGVGGSTREPDGAWSQLGTSAAAISLAGGAIDAMFWWGGRSAPEIASVAAVRPLRALDLAAYVEPANGLVDGVYQTVRIPGSVYGQPEVRTLGVAAHLMCRDDLGDGEVSLLVDLVSDSAPSLVPQPSDGVQYYAPSTLFDTSPVPLHPAAERRMRERHG